MAWPRTYRQCPQLHRAVALVQHGAQPAARVAGDPDPGPVQADPPRDGAELRRQVHHGQPVQQVLDPGVQDRFLDAVIRLPELDAAEVADLALPGMAEATEPPETWGIF